MDRLRSDVEYYKTQLEVSQFEVNRLNKMVEGLSSNYQENAKTEMVMERLNPSYLRELKEKNLLGQYITLLKEGQFINAIKTLRTATMCGLKEGKDFTEAVRDGKVPNNDIPF
jgi:ribosomal protein L7/L12